PPRLPGAASRHRPPPRRRGVDGRRRPHPRLRRDLPPPPIPPPPRLLRRLWLPARLRAGGLLRPGGWEGDVSEGGVTLGGGGAIGCRDESNRADGVDPQRREFRSGAQAR